MIQVDEFYHDLKERGVDFFCGVPDSLLKNFCAYVFDHTEKENHIITANEGNAVALACGHYLVTGKPGLVYMQNSGLGNCVNPLLSLADEDVYKIPLLMLVGWRGQPGEKDEPQHVKQGKVTDSLLEAMGIEYSVLPENGEEARDLIETALSYIKESGRPYAFMVKKGTFSDYKVAKKSAVLYEMGREEAIGMLTDALDDDDIVVATTGHISRELYEYRNSRNEGHKRDFLTVGSMGHASSIAMGIALEKKNKNVVCYDGDGAFLMHMGVLPVIASMDLPNFKHVVFNNVAHDSVGGQPTAAGMLDFKVLAKASGYKSSFSVCTMQELKDVFPSFLERREASLLEIKVRCGARADLGRPKEKPVENKNEFMDFLKGNRTFSGHGAIMHLRSILTGYRSGKILVMVYKSISDEYRAMLDEQLSGMDYRYYSGFSANPKVEELEEALKACPENYDVYVAFGGGSVIDFTKLFRCSRDHSMVDGRLFPKEGTFRKGSVFVAIPTTAGTGSEATSFAVYYMNGIKYSLSDPSLLPDYAILDSAFTACSPRYLKACSGMDAFCQALESYWSIRSTMVSEEYALEAIRICRKNLVQFVNSDSEEAALKMLNASNLAGKAINLTTTTAVHALSYKMTSRYGIPHGHAVAIGMAGIFKKHLMATEKTLVDVRGLDYFKKKMEGLLEASGIGSGDVTAWFRSLFEEIGLEFNAVKLGITDFEEIAASVDAQRLANNPVLLSQDDLVDVLNPRWVGWE